MPKARMQPYGDYRHIELQDRSARSNTAVSARARVPNHHGSHD